MDLFLLSQCRKYVFLRNVIMLSIEQDAKVKTEWLRTISQVYIIPWDLVPDRVL